MTRAGPLFLSYSSHDGDAADAVQRLLTAAGIGKEVWRDQRSIERDWSREIAHALANAEAVVSLWSADAAQSDWVRHEWLTARALEKPILAILLDETPLPPPLQNLQAVVATDGPPCADAVANRLAAVLSEPPDYDFTIAPAGVSIPLAPNPNFVGRDDDVLELYLSLIGEFNSVGIRAVGSVGMGGVGKTQLAVEFAHRFAFAFDGVHWIDATEPESWVQRFVGLARDDLRLQLGDASHGSDREWVWALRAHCAQHPNLLLIMDNVTDPEDLADSANLLGVAPLEFGCHLLFSTRQRFDLPGVSPHAVGLLEPDAAYELLTSRRDPAGEEEDARAICSALGHLPLALVLASAYLARFRELGFGDYRRALAKNRLETVDIQQLSPAKLATRHAAAVRLTLENQSTALVDPDARLLFRLAGQLPEGALIPTGRLGLLAGLQQEPGALVRPLDAACLELVDLSLAELAAEGSALRLHPLVHQYASDLVADPAAERSAAAERVAATYARPDALEREYARRGPAGVIEDVETGLDWSEAGSGARSALASLADILNTESAALNRFPHSRYPAFLLQQVANRAALLGHDEIAARMRAGMTDGRQRFDLLWRTHSKSAELERTIVGPRSWMRRVVFSPSGRLVVTLAEDSNQAGALLMVSDTGTGQLIEQIDPGEEISGLCFASDDAHILTTGSGGKLRRWDLGTGRVDREAAGGGDGLGALTPTADGRTALTSGEGNALLAWDLERWSEPREVGFTGHGADVIAALPDGVRVLVGSYSGAFSETCGFLEEWNLDTGERLRVIEAHDYAIEVILIDDEAIVTAGRDDRVRFWDRDSLALAGELRLTRPWAGAPVSPGVAAIGAERDIVLIDVTHGEVLRELKGHAGVLMSIDVARDGAARLASAAADGTARLWRLDRVDPESRTQSRPGHGAAVLTGLVLDDVAVTGDDDGDLKLWSLETGETLAHDTFYTGYRGNAVATRDGRTVLTSSADLEGGAILALDVNSGQEKSIVPTAGRVEFIGLDRDEHVLVVTESECVYVYEAYGTGNVKGALRHVLRGPRAYPDAAAMTPDGALLAVAASDSFGGAEEIGLFDVLTGALAPGTCEVDDHVNAMRITPDGSHVAFATNAGQLGVWEPGTSPPRILVDDLGEGPELALDGGRVITAADELCLWDIDSGRLLRRLGGHPGIWHVEVVQPGLVLTASHDWTVSLWDVDAGTELCMLALDGEASVATLGPRADVFVCADRAGDVYAFRLVKEAG